MCHPSGKPKAFQTQLKGLAEFKAREETRKSGRKIRIYFCLFCRHWCLTSQEPKHPNGASRKRARLLRKAVEAWENEGGALHPKDLKD